MKIMYTKKTNEYCGRIKLHTHIREFKKRRAKEKFKNKSRILDYKISSRIYKFKRSAKNTDNFTLSDFLQKFSNPKCYLTGTPIDLTQTSTYHLDHIIPVSKGGSANLDNLGLLLPEINNMKLDHSIEKIVNLCKMVSAYANSQNIN